MRTPERQDHYTSSELNKFKYYLLYRKVFRKLKEYLQDDLSHYQAKRIIPSLPNNKEKAIEKIERVLERALGNSLNIKRLQKILAWIEDGDYISSIRNILKLK